MENKVISEMLRLRQRDLVSMIATGGEGENILSRDSEGDYELGRFRFLQALPKIKSTLCSDPVRDTVKLEKDREKLVVSISEILSGVLFGVPVVTISCLVIKIGLDKVCKKSGDEILLEIEEDISAEGNTVPE